MERLCACPCRRPLPEGARANRIYYEPDTCRKRVQALQAAELNPAAADLPETFWARIRAIRPVERGVALAGARNPRVAS